MEVVLVKLREHFPNIIHNKLRELSVVILDYKAEEFAVVIIHYIAHFLLERKWRQLLPLKFGVIICNL